MINPTIASKEVTLHILRTFGLRLSKKLGQNFLINKSIVDGIVKAAEIKADDIVLEVGPGIGTLTQGLAETGAEITSVEIDQNLLGVLAKTLAGYNNIRIIHGDILKIDIPQEMSGKSFKVVANLPYYITTPIILKLLEDKLPIECIVTMVQKEVAERMVAKPGGKDYGALSVAVQYYTKPEIMFEVPPKSFIPEPAVDSAVIKCVVRKEPPVELLSEKHFFHVVKASFAQRRKTLANSIKCCGMSKEVATEVLAKSNIDGIRRGETLTLEEFARIANNWLEIERARQKS